MALGGKLDVLLAMENVPASLNDSIADVVAAVVPAL
jgi:hypothetical protein